MNSFQETIQGGGMDISIVTLELIYDKLCKQKIQGVNGISMRQTLKSKISIALQKSVFL